MPILSLCFLGAQNSRRQILLTSTMSCCLLLLDLGKSSHRYGADYCNLKSFLLKWLIFQLLFKTVYSNPLNMAPTALCPSGGIWIKKTTTGEN